MFNKAKLHMYGVTVGARDVTLLKVVHQMTLPEITRPSPRT